jgi:hypothetical protein
MRLTKAFYSRALFDGLEKTADRQLDRHQFQVAVRLAVQSGSAELFEKIDWNENS